ncbi:MAG: DUF411 domain-containing protein [Gammaproteobacteria bacterium]|jgi:hypothetical protein
MIKYKKITAIVLTIFISALSSFSFLQKASAESEMTVYKSPTCGCCNKWITHMEENGFKVKAVDVIEMNIVKQKYGIKRNLASCHTAIIDGYFIEGHVPAADIKRLLAEKTDSKGLTVPGMPVGSPGMEMGDRIDSYQVLSVKSDGSTDVFNQY